MEDGSLEIKKKRRIDNVDRISSLPEPLLQHIMSFLPFKQVVQTSVLSKVWKEAWHTFPDLEFDESKLQNCPFTTQKHDEKILQARPFWDQILRIRHRDRVGVRKITLKTGDSELADRCACYAIENNVKELVLECYGRSLDVRYSLPQTVLCSKSMEVLKLAGCKLEYPRSDLKSSLRELHLCHVYADDHLINKVLSGCPLIEDLEVVDCQGFRSLKLFGLTKLRKIKLERNEELKQLKTDALNANSSISIIGMRVPYEVYICKNLNSLYLTRSYVTDEWLCSNISRLPFLEELAMTQINNIEIINISSPRLKRLDILMCTKLVEVKIETPNLRIFTYDGDIISFSSGAALTLSETYLCFTPCKNGNLCFSSSDNIEPQWYAKYIELLAKFRRFSEVLNLQSFFSETLLIPGELRQILPPPLSGVKHLNFTIRITMLNYALAKVVDTLLWISPHVETICLEYEVNKKFYFQFSYKEQPLYERETAQCCKSLPVVSCWEHCIRKVDIQITSTHIEYYNATYEIRKRINVERCSLEGENILEKIDGLAVSGVPNITNYD